MKKSLIALAALATVATAAQAQSSVTVYGLLDAGVLVRNAGNADGANQTTMASGVLATPRFGFRGSEDLGGGLKAVFQLESGISNTTGANGASPNLFDRYAYVGIANTIGQIDLGRNTHAGWNAAAAGITDILALQGEGLSVTAGAVSTTIVPNWRTNQVISIVGNTALGTTRSDSAIKFTSNKFNGFTLRAVYGIGGQAGDSDKRASYSAGVIYENGPFAAAASTFEAKDNTGIKKLKNESYGASYTVGNLKFVAGYHELKADAGYARTHDTSNLSLGSIANGTTGSAVLDQPLKNGGTGDSKTSLYNLGASYQWTPAFNSAIGYYNSKFENASFAAANGSHLKTVVLVNKYSLSKRTTIYGVVDNAKADAGLQTSGKNTSLTGFTVGVNHTF